MATGLRLEDLTYVPFSERPTTAIKTGTWKYVEPVYQNALPPCAGACPAGNDISYALLLLAQGRVMEAARWWRQRNPIPATLGRVCPHPCERPCNREALGGAIAVHMVERFLGDVEGDVVPQPAPRSGKKVAVVGSGPAGLAAAYNLRLAGHQVCVFDDKPAPGGYLRTGIPEYRLPRQVLDREVGLIAHLGVEFRQRVRVGREVGFDELRRVYDAVVVAVGFHKSRSLGIPGEDHPQVYNGVKLLERLLAGERPPLPSRMVVVGGGNTAMDVARSLWRVGVEPVVVYRRTREEMPAIASEVEEALAEGIPFQFLAAPVRVVVEEGRIVGLECQRMELGEPDASGRRRPVPVPGSEFVVPCGGVVTALGEVVDLEGLPGELAKGDARQCTPLEGVFLAGDMLDGAGTVTAAVGSGIRVAAVVHAYLTGQGLPQVAPAVQELWPRPLERQRLVEWGKLNTVYFRAVPRPPIHHLPPELRRGDFAEVVQGWSVAEVLGEARRCLACGTCNECCNCLYFCPDVAIHRADGGFSIDREHCKGCGICVQECPRSALILREVTR
ncbi:MAG: NAD(P)-binding protein [Thermoanaerobaculum sp.]|nr:NAD(P)-binding protein [Thermoanaerobaculum sp.]